MRRRWRPAAALAAVAVAVLATASCSSRSAPGRLHAVVYSPNGEPLAGRTDGRPCEEVIAAWFARVDADGDGRVDAAEFMADARRQFRAMDRDGDGFVTPAELAALRAPFEAAPARAARRADADQAGPGMPRRRSERRGGELDRGDQDQPDPVMSADANLDNRVSEEEFLRHAERRFAALGGRKAAGLTIEAARASCRERQD